MKKSQLHELIKHIARSVLREITVMSATKNGSQQGIESDPSASPEAELSPALKARMEREKEHQRQQQIKQTEVELAARKKEMDFNKKKLDQQKRFDIPNMTKDLQRLKGAKI